MAVYFVTGKLGGGKTLMSVGKIKEKLLKNLPVATNLELNLSALVGNKAKQCRVYRMPDKPDIQDFEAIGRGNESYDESKNGLIVLDECGTWFNSRQWADKTRQAVINWLLHARKLGWDIIFIVQDISIVDKQARLALAEHVVYCRRFDRLTVPFVGPLYSLFVGGKLPLPKVHLGIVRYGDSQTAMKVDSWLTLGFDLYQAYDTKQAFSDFYENRVYSVLPPFYTKGRYMVRMDVKNIMRMTKIYFKRYSRILAFALGAVGSYALAYLQYYQEPLTVVQEVNTVSLSETLSGYSISSYTNLPFSRPYYEISNNATGLTLDSKQLHEMGYGLQYGGACRLTVVDSLGASVDVTCY